MTIRAPPPMQVVFSLGLEYLSVFSRALFLSEGEAVPVKPTRQNEILIELEHQFVPILIAAATIVVSRRPDAFFNPQFFAEDGVVWFPDAYNLGLRSLLVPQAGYLHTLTRLIALLTLLFPFSLAPEVMNVCALAVQVLPVSLFLSERFSTIPMRTRLLGAFLYLALPNSYEVHANITTLQWHLALLACLVLFAAPSKSLGWRIFDICTIALISIDGPMGIVLVPVAGAIWWKRRDNWARTLWLAGCPGAILQTATVMISKVQRSASPNGASLIALVHIVTRQVFLSSLVGLNNTLILYMKVPFAVEVSITIAGILAILWALWHGPTELKLFIVFVTLILAAALANPLATEVGTQWEALSVPGTGNRYFFLPTIAFLAALLWTATDSRLPRTRLVRAWATMLLFLLPVGVLSDWEHPPFVDLNFPMYARAFENAASGTHLTIPINPPGWFMELSKH